jgi:hypothetical protein
MWSALALSTVWTITGINLAVRSIRAAYLRPRSGLKDSRLCAECTQAGFCYELLIALIEPNRRTSPRGALIEPNRRTSPRVGGARCASFAIVARWAAYSGFCLLPAASTNASGAESFQQRTLKFLPSRSSRVHTPVVLCPGAQKKETTWTVQNVAAISRQNAFA